MVDQLDAKYYLHEMNEMIIQQLCKELNTKIKTKVIRKIQKHSACVLEHSSLKNMWDEVCVIVQSGDNAYYDHCVNVIDGEIDLILNSMMLANWQLSAMWLQTQEGLDWVFDHKDKIPEEISLIYNQEDISKYIREEYILDAAMNWSNDRIEKFHESSYEMDDMFY